MWKQIKLMRILKLPESESSPVPVTILGDTSAKQSFIRAGVLPFSDDTYCS